jgi:hypothetical protein
MKKLLSDAFWPWGHKEDLMMHVIVGMETGQDLVKLRIYVKCNKEINLSQTANSMSRLFLAATSPCPQLDYALHGRWQGQCQ